MIRDRKADGEMWDEVRVATSSFYNLIQMLKYLKIYDVYTSGEYVTLRASYTKKYFRRQDDKAT